jgi:uncharacterized protein YjbJ (UPF0337 family)
MPPSSLPLPISIESTGGNGNGLFTSRHDKSQIRKGPRPHNNESGEPMSIEKNINNYVQIWKGKARKKLGRTLHSKPMTNRGMRDELSGSFKQAVEKVKHALKK